MGNIIQLKDNAGNNVFPVAAAVKKLTWDSQYDTDIIATARNYILRETTEGSTHYFYFSADCGKTWTKAANTIGVVTFCHFFGNGVVLLCSNDYCYTTTDFSTFTKSSVYDYDGSAFVSNTSAHSFFSLSWQNNQYHELDGQEVLIWNDYNVNTGYVSRVWMSLDYGATIRCILKNGVTQDTNGNTITTRHFHRVWLEDDLGVLWVTSGDTGNECRLTKGTYANGSWTWETVGTGERYKIGQFAVKRPYAYFVTDYTSGTYDTGLICCPVAALNDPTKFRYIYKSDNKEALSKWFEDVNGNKVILGDGATYNAIWYARGNYDFAKIAIAYSTNTLALFNIYGPNLLGQVIVQYFPTGGWNNAGNLTLTGQHHLLLSDLMHDAGVADFGNAGNIIGPLFSQLSNQAL